jgi:periplasmic divalent cation tolerance protein
MMEQSTRYVMVVISAPAEAAHDLARALVEEGAAACAQITKEIQSIYFWKGAVTEESEVLIFLKTAALKVEAVKRIVAARHPYEVPELIVLPITDGNASYFQWIEEVTGRGEKRA